MYFHLLVMNKTDVRVNTMNFFPDIYPLVGKFTHSQECLSMSHGAAFLNRFAFIHWVPMTCVLHKFNHAVHL